MSDIIVGYDASSGSRAALDCALEMATHTGGKVVAVFGYRDPFLGGETGDLQKSLQEVGHARLAEAVEQATKAGAQIETMVVSESPAQALADVAERRDAQMIVVASQGESPLKGALLGDTPHKLLHVTTKPVLIVPV